nr:molybdopterin-dependent oxidoreductase [Nocardioides mesophilus]
MALPTPGFAGRPRRPRSDLPPGQYLTDDFPVLSAGPTPRVDLASWQLSVTTETGEEHAWSWPELQALPHEEITVDLHCVTRWSKLGTSWTGVSLDAILADVETEADFVMAASDGGYTTNLPLEDLLDGKAWVVHAYDGEPLSPSTAGRCGCWCRTSTCGRAPSGCAGSG